MASYQELLALTVTADMSTPLSYVHFYDHGQPKWRSGIFFMTIRDFLGKVGGDMGGAGSGVLNVCIVD